LKKCTTPDSRNTPSTTNLEEEETVDAPGNDNASMPEQVKRPNPCRKMMMMIFYCSAIYLKRILVPAGYNPSTFCKHNTNFLNKKFPE